MWTSSKGLCQFLYVVLYFFLEKEFQIIWTSNATKPASVPCRGKGLSMGLVRKNLPGKEMAHMYFGLFVCFYPSSCHLSLKINFSHVTLSEKIGNVLSYLFPANTVITFIGLFLVPLTKGKSPMGKYS